MYLELYINLHPEVRYQGRWFESQRVQGGVQVSHVLR